MASFFWKAQLDAGHCLTCGTAFSDRGFVDLVSDEPIQDPEGNLYRWNDIYLCGTCIDQISGLVGNIPKAETEKFAEREYELVSKLEKLKDETDYYKEKADLYDRIMVVREFDAVNAALESRSDPATREPEASGGQARSEPTA